MTLKEKFENNILTVKYLDSDKASVFNNVKIVDDFDTFIEIIYGFKTSEEAKIILNKSRIICIVSK